MRVSQKGKYEEEKREEKVKKAGREGSLNRYWEQATTAVKAGRMLARQQQAFNLPEAGTGKTRISAWWFPMVVNANAHGGCRT
jgi:hypothetical protein